MIIISQLWCDGTWQDEALNAGKAEITLRDAVGAKARKLAGKFRESGA